MIVGGAAHEGDKVNRTAGTPDWIDRMKAEPHLILPGTIAWLRGIWCKVWFPLTGRRFRAGRRLRVYGSLTISGPGRIEFGDDVLVIGNAIRGVSLRTLSRGAVVRLDRHAGLNGTSIQCIERVEIGELSNIADAFISRHGGACPRPQSPSAAGRRRRACAGPDRPQRLDLGPVRGPSRGQHRRRFGDRRVLPGPKGCSERGLCGGQPAAHFAVAAR
jgi:hypothetical protein